MPSSLYGSRKCPMRTWRTPGSTSSPTKTSRKRTFPPASSTSLTQLVESPKLPCAPRRTRRSRIRFADRRSSPGSRPIGRPSSRRLRSVPAAQTSAADGRAHRRNKNSLSGADCHPMGGRRRQVPAVGCLRQRLGLIRRSGRRWQQNLRESRGAAANGDDQTEQLFPPHVRPISSTPPPLLRRCRDCYPSPHHRSMRSCPGVCEQSNCGAGSGLHRGCCPAEIAGLLQQLICPDFVQTAP